MSQTISEKLQIPIGKTILIQGLPSSIEKQLSKLSFAKNLTPTLRTRKVDFALIFAVNETQLDAILSEIMPALKDESQLWVAYPKITSRIATDLNRVGCWKKLTSAGYDTADHVSLDHVWHALQFKKIEGEPEYVLNPQSAANSSHRNRGPISSEAKEKNLSIEIEFPEGISEQEAKEIIIKLSLLADLEHRALGGHGLKLDTIEADKLIPILEEVTI